MNASTRNALLLATLLAALALFRATTRISARRFVRTTLAALFAGAHAAATLFNSLIALSVVCHSFPPYASLSESYGLVVAARM